MKNETEKLEWEKSFDEKRKEIWHYCDVNDEYTIMMKDFIHNLLIESRKDFLREILPSKKEITLEKPKLYQINPQIATCRMRKEKQALTLKI